MSDEIAAGPTCSGRTWSDAHVIPHAQKIANDILALQSRLKEEHECVVAELTCISQELLADYDNSTWSCLPSGFERCGMNLQLKPLVPQKVAELNERTGSTPRSADGQPADQAQDFASLDQPTDQATLASQVEPALDPKNSRGPMGFHLRTIWDQSDDFLCQALSAMGPAAAPPKRNKSAFLQSSKSLSKTGSMFFASDTDRRRVICKSLLSPIHPSSSTYVWWTFIGLILLSYDFVVLPLHYFFQMPATGFGDIRSWAAPAYWTCDMMLCFRTGFWYEDQLIMEGFRISNHYLNTYFAFDLILLLIDWCVFGVLDARLLQLSLNPAARSTLRVVRLIRLVRLLRVVKVWGTVEDVASSINPFRSDVTHLATRIAKLAFGVLAANHLLACGWFSIGSSSSEGWVNAYHVDTMPLSSKYLVSFQWALSRFHGAQNISSHTNAERVYSLLCLVLGMIVVAVIIGTTSQVTAELREVWREYERRRRAVYAYVHRFRISQELSLRVSKFMSFSHSVKTDAESVLSELPLDVHMELHFEARAPELCHHHLFQFLASHFMHPLVRICHHCMVDLVVAKRDNIFFPGAAFHHMLLVRNGRLCYETNATLFSTRNGMQHVASDPGDDPSIESSKRQHLRKGSMVSEVALWVQPWATRGKLRAVEESALLSIDSARLEDYAASFLGVHASMVLYAREFVRTLSDLSTDLADPVEFDLLEHSAEFVGRAGKKQFDFFLSHTQRDDAAKLIATELYSELAEVGKGCWLDVKMDRCDRAAMMNGVKNSKVFIAIVTDNGVNSYFSREMCRAEITWALDLGKTILPVVAVADKHRIGEFLAEGRKYGFDFSEYNFCQYDRSGREYCRASIKTICLQAGCRPSEIEHHAPKHVRSFSSVSQSFPSHRRSKPARQHTC